MRGTRGPSALLPMFLLLHVLREAGTMSCQLGGHLRETQENIRRIALLEMDRANRVQNMLTLYTNRQALHAATCATCGGA